MVHVIFTENSYTASRFGILYTFSCYSFISKHPENLYEFREIPKRTHRNVM